MKLYKLVKGKKYLDEILKERGIEGLNEVLKEYEELGATRKMVEGMWILTGDTIVVKSIKELLEKGFEKSICRNIEVVVHDRLFLESRPCYRKGDEAYITESVYEGLW